MPTPDIFVFSVNKSYTRTYTHNMKRFAVGDGKQERGAIPMSR